MPRPYTRADLLRHVGHLAQLGGTRHVTLAEGRAKGMAAIDFDTGAGLTFTVLPDRGLDIDRASYRGVNLVYLGPGGPAHPAFYEPEGLGWLRTFGAGLLTTCGLTWYGAPGADEGRALGLHGRYSHLPARQVCDLSRWEGDEYVLEVRGVVEEAALFGDKVRLTRTITSLLGSRKLTIHDVAENFGYRPAPLTILYHINFGFPLLDESTEVVVSAESTEPYDAHSAEGLERIGRHSAPADEFPEENFLHKMRPDAAGYGRAAIINRQLAGGLGVEIRHTTGTLPYMNQWKLLAAGDYVTALEPASAPVANRALLRQRGQLPMLAPGETRTMEVEISILTSDEALQFAI